MQAQRRVYNEQRYLLAQTQDTLVSVTTQRDEGLEKLAQYVLWLRMVVVAVRNH